MRKIAKAWSILFLALGVLGFVPAATPGGLLFGVFHADLLHNALRLATGIIGLTAANFDGHIVKAYFLSFGILYAIIAMLSFVGGEKSVAGLFASNRADAWLYLAVASLSVCFGLLPPALGRESQSVA